MRLMKVADATGIQEEIPTDMKSTLNSSVRRFITTLSHRVASIRFGMILLVVVTAFTLVAAFYPVKDGVQFTKDIAQFLMGEDATGITSISFQDHFKSTEFVLLVGLVSLSLFLSLSFRIKSEFNRWRKRRLSWMPHHYSIRQAANPHAALVERELKRRGYRVAVVADHQRAEIRGSKGQAGVWGSILFHASVLLILLGVALSTFASFEASVGLTEGQTFDSQTDRYGVQKSGSLYPSSSPHLSMRLVRVEPEYLVNGATTVASIIESSVGGRVERFPVYINHGASLGGKTIHQGFKTGYSPLIVIERQDGQALLNGYTRLATVAVGGKELYRDFIEFPDRNLRAEFEFFPNVIDTIRDEFSLNGSYEHRSSNLNNPVLRVALLDNGKTIFDQHLLIGSSAPAGGYTISFADVRRWTQIDVSDDPGQTVLILGSLFGAIGLALRLVCVRRRVVVIINSLHSRILFDVSGSAEKFQETFKEDLSSLRLAISEQLKKVQVSRHDESVPVCQPHKSEMVHFLGEAAPQNVGKPEARVSEEVL